MGQPCNLRHGATVGREVEKTKETKKPKKKKKQPSEEASNEHHKWNLEVKKTKHIQKRRNRSIFSWGSSGQDSWQFRGGPHEKLSGRSPPHRVHSCPTKNLSPIKLLYHPLRAMLLPKASSFLSCPGSFELRFTGMRLEIAPFIWNFALRGHLVNPLSGHTMLGSTAMRGAPGGPPLPSLRNGAGGEVSAIEICRCHSGPTLVKMASAPVLGPLDYLRFQGFAMSE